MNWQVKDGDRLVGPCTEDEVDDGLREGTIAATAFVRQADDAVWQPIGLHFQRARGPVARPSAEEPTAGPLTESPEAPLQDLLEEFPGEVSAGPPLEPVMPAPIEAAGITTTIVLQAAQVKAANRTRLWWAAAACALTFIVAAIGFGFTIHDWADATHDVRWLTLLAAQSALLALSVFAAVPLCFALTRSVAVRIVSLCLAAPVLVMVLFQVALMPEAFRAVRASAEIGHLALTPTEDGTAIELEGEIGLGDGERVEMAAAGLPMLRRIVIDSNGGLLDPALIIARLVERRGLEVIVRGECASACLLVMFAAKQRYASIDSRFGLHSPGLVTPLSAWAQAGTETPAKTYFDFLSSHGLSEDYLALARATPIERISTVGPAEWLTKHLLAGLVDDEGHSVSLAEARWQRVEQAFGRPSGSDAGIRLRQRLAQLRREYPEVVERAMTQVKGDLAEAPAEVRGRQLVQQLLAETLAAAPDAAVQRYFETRLELALATESAEDWTTCAYMAYDGRRPREHGFEPAVRERLFAAIEALLVTASDAGWRPQPRSGLTAGDTRQLGDRVLASLKAKGIDALSLAREAKHQCRYGVGLMRTISALPPALATDYYRALQVQDVHSIREFGEP